LTRTLAIDDARCDSESAVTEAVVRVEVRAARGSVGLGRALRHRNYRLYFAGQSLSLIGTWITRVAQSWLVYRLSGSPLLLGLVGFASQIPTFVLAPFAGVWLDRLDRHRVLVVTQALAAIQSGLLALFSLTHTITVTHVLVLGAFQSSSSSGWA
jgi:MFS family permease